MARDPVCGMSVVPEQAAARREFAGVTYHFCREGCAMKFSAEPQKYLAKSNGSPGRPSSANAAAPSGAAASVWMASGVSLGSRTMLDRAKPLAVAGGETVYTCPMDPEIRQTKQERAPSVGWRSKPWSRHRSRLKRNTPAQCTRGWSATRRAPVRSAGWR